MPPRKRNSSSAATADVPPPAPRRSTRSASSLGRSNSSTADDTKTSSASTSASKPASTAPATTPEMGSAVSKAKALKAKRARKTNGETPGSDVSSRIEELTVDEAAIGGSTKGKRKSTTSAEVKAAGAKKARLSKGSTHEEEDVEVPPAPAPSKAKAAGSKKAPKTVEEWFGVYASEGDSEQIDVEGIIRLLGDLDVKFESAAIYILCWKLGLEAMGSIPKKKWVDGMNKYGLKNNQQLLKSLAIWLEETKPVSPPSTSFVDFFKYMFQFSKATPETRSVAIDDALPVMSFALDPLTYDLKYDPDTAVSIKPEVHPYPHRQPFLDFLATKQPVKVINKDQWESFIPFNRAVSYTLEDYNPEGAWPSLYDQYVEWRRESDSTGVGPKDGPDTKAEI
ncbi:DCN1-like protein 4 [Orbilia brochopaga]|uniref:Defective in cullin neddylation protein n=1 Tax=Orbilia brochopaga TaxID=3140254 RepID=A0AAV9TYK6_9PEZI